MAATALAIRLYETDNVERPGKLSALVPDYLPAVPVDPFSPDASPIRYQPHDEGNKRARLYSVGRDGKDNGGVRHRSSDRRTDREGSDIPFDLSAKPRGDGGDSTVKGSKQDSGQTAHNDADNKHDQR